MSDETVPLDDLFRARARTREPLARCAIDWAVELLARGWNSPAVALLAGLPPDEESQVVEMSFRETLIELGVAPFDDVEAGLREARALACMLLDGSLDPRGAVARIHEVAVSPLGHPSALQPWCDLDGGFVTGARGHVTKLEGAAWEAAARAEAERFLAQSVDDQIDHLRGSAKRETRS